MKLRTTVQLTGAISNTVAIAQSKKTSLKREDSFITRFSTRQVAEAQVSNALPSISNQCELVE